MSRRTKHAIGKVVDRLLTAMTILMLCAGVVMLYRANIIRNQPPEPSALAEANLQTLPFLSVIDAQGANHTIDLRGRTHAIYAFSTLCHFCESQRDYMSKTLSALDSGSVITVSEEPPEVIKSYWEEEVGSKLKTPLSVPVGTLEQLGVHGVPALIFVGSRGDVKAAYLGTALGWDADRFRAELARK